LLGKNQEDLELAAVANVIDAVTFPGEPTSVFGSLSWKSGGTGSLLYEDMCASYLTLEEWAMSLSMMKPCIFGSTHFVNYFDCFEPKNALLSFLYQFL
jgi:hypothetical protein